MSHQTDYLLLVITSVDYIIKKTKVTETMHDILNQSEQFALTISYVYWPCVI